MTTPAIYAAYAARALATWSRYRWRLAGTILATASIPAILERVYPVGPILGNTLFICLMIYIAGLMPLLVFSGPLPPKPWSFRQAAWAWVRTILCSLWIAFWLWAIKAGFSGSA